MKTSPQHRGIDRAGQHSIHPDGIGGKFNGHGPRQGQQAAFAGSIRGYIGRGGHSMYGRNVDNRAASLGLEQRVGQFGAQKDRAQVGSHHLIPFLGAGFEQTLGHLKTGVVDQSIQCVRKLAGLGINPFQRAG